jgi:curved DNA-binding protein CbpA
MNDPGSRDLYAVLGVAPTADSATLRAAYRARAHVSHPDRGGTHAAMTRLNLAYYVLGDAHRRAVYDAERAAATRDREQRPHWTGAAGPPPGRPSGPVLDFGLFDGWSLGEIIRRDPGYLAWLAERKEGAPYLDAIEALLAPLRTAAAGRRSRR